MCVQMDESHSITPPIPNDLLSKSGMKLIEGDSQLLGPVLPSLLIDGPSIEKSPLLGITS